MAEFRECVRVLAEKVGVLTRQRAELIDRYTKAEASHEELTKELNEKKELVNTLYVKLQSEKQVSFFTKIHTGNRMYFFLFFFLII